MSQLHRVMNMSAKPVWAAYNGKVYIWDPHPSKEKGHYILEPIPGKVPIPRHIPQAQRDTVYVEMEGMRGDRLVKTDGVNKYIHHVPEDFMRQLVGSNLLKHKDQYQNTSGLVMDQHQIDSLDAALEQRRDEDKRLDASKEQKKKELLELQAQIDAAQERAKALGLLKVAQEDAGIPTAKGKVIGG